jgi:Fe-S-cluster formation regulator IscX/YfhJ
MIKMITHELTHRNVEDVFDREVRSKELHDIIVKGREYDSRGIKRKWLQTGL